MMWAAVSATRMVAFRAVRSISMSRIFTLRRDTRGRLFVGPSCRLLVTPAGPSVTVSSGLDVEADLRSALVHEKIDLSSLDEDISSTLKTLWVDCACRTKLRGELANFTRAKIDWDALLRVYESAEKQKQDGKTAVRDYVEKKASLTPGAAGAVSRYVYHQIQMSRVTPFMRALGEFPRHIYHGAALSPDLAPWMPEELVNAVRSARASYTQFWNAHFGRAPLVPLNDAEKYISDSMPPEFMEHAVLPLWRAIEAVWPADPSVLAHFGGPQLPVWFSSFRRRELERQLQVCALLERLPEGDTHHGRTWLGGRALGKTELQRVTALLIALLQPMAVVGYCAYSKCELSPLQILHMTYPPQSPPPQDPAALLRERRFIVFYADEVEHLYYRYQRDALYQISDLGDMAYALSTLSGNTALLPALISGRDRPEQWRNLPPLNPSKHPYEHVPPLTSLVEARDLAATIVPALKLDDEVLRELCWLGAGSLSYMVQALKAVGREGVPSASAIRQVVGLPETPAIPNDRTDPFSAVLGVFWRRWDAVGKVRGPFRLPSVWGEDLMHALTHIGVRQPDQALQDVQDRGLIYSPTARVYCLVYPHMVEQYASLVSPK